jgi:hypothetical protein
MNIIFRVMLGLILILAGSFIFGSDQWRSNQAHAESKTASITVLTPNGGEKIKFGEVYEIRWTSTNLDRSKLINIWINLDYVTGENNISIAKRVPNTGTYAWVTTDPKNYELYDGGLNGLKELEQVLSRPANERPRFKIAVGIIEENIVDMSNAPFNFE